MPERFYFGCSTFVGWDERPSETHSIDVATILLDFFGLLLFRYSSSHNLKQDSNSQLYSHGRRSLTTRFNQVLVVVQVPHFLHSLREEAPLVKTRQTSLKN